MTDKYSYSICEKVSIEINHIVIDKLIFKIGTDIPLQLSFKLSSGGAVGNILVKSMIGSHGFECQLPTFFS